MRGLLYGLHGLFFSPGKSLFLYNPPLIVRCWRCAGAARLLRHSAATGAGPRC